MSLHAPIPVQTAEWIAADNAMQDHCLVRLMTDTGSGMADLSYGGGIEPRLPRGSVSFGIGL